MAEYNKDDAKGLRNLRSVNKATEDSTPAMYGKLPPQAVPLEEAILGAIMLDKDAFAIVLDILRPDSFYKDAHQKIYQAMRGLFEMSYPIDLLTVTEGLRKQGDLEAVGGPHYIVELTRKVASAANIEYHARIVAQKYIQRELIRISTKVIKNAYEDTTDVFELLDSAEQGLFEITQNNLNSSYESMGSLASKFIKSLEDLKEQEAGLTGIPTGFKEVDNLTSGFQRSDLIIIAARPGMGKTAFILSMARNTASMYEKPIAVFSLEMSSLQLVQRLISLETEISAHKLRSGQLEDYEWKQLSIAIERMSEVPIFIDDTPSISIFELRAKCRRLKKLHNIEMVIIDYLQLMTGNSDGNRGGNREQEVSGISRSLKALAKELNVPVIALSQLSRAVEVRGGTKRPQLSDLRESGCLTGDALLIHAETGALMAIEQLANRKEQTLVPILAMNEDYTISKHTLSRAFFSGEKEVFELTTRSGRTIKASANHPFRTLSGWTPLEQLQIKNRIAIARKITTETPKNSLKEDELILLAHLIGDGCILPEQPYHYTSADIENIKIVNQKAEALFDISANVVEQKNWWHTYLKSPYHLTHGKKHPITIWYDKLGLSRERSYEKEIPEGVFLSDEQHIAIFLKHLWATDGNISWKILPNRKPASAIYYASSSLKLAQQVQHLLLRLGINSTMRRVSQGKHRDNYHVAIQGKEQQLTFLNKVGCHGKRGDVIQDMREAFTHIQANPNYDTIPQECWDLMVKPTLKSKGISQSQFAEILAIAKSSATYKTAISRKRLTKVASVLQDQSLEVLANSDVYWDEIVSIKSLGVQKVYDATVEGVHNFLANDIIVHNSIEQDADMVSFIYRPEYYQITEDENGDSLKGVAEIIFAKNRHGATKTVRLKFTEQFAKFSDLDDFSLDDLGNATYESNVIKLPSKMNDTDDIPF